MKFARDSHCVWFDIVGARRTAVVQARQRAIDLIMVSGDVVSYPHLRFLERNQRSRCLYIPSRDDPAHTDSDTDVIGAARSPEHHYNSRSVWPDGVFSRLTR